MKLIPIEQAISLPPFVLDTIDKLQSAGYLAYLVGGSVRDFLLGNPSKDFDLVTDALPNDIDDLFSPTHFVKTRGKAFGVMQVSPFLQESGNDTSLGKKKGLEIATFRKDLNYLDHRHPSGVVFSSPREDALRRDFTVNALFYDPTSQCLLDAVGGFDDLQKRILRAIGNASDRFQEDALRLLRAIRFVANLKFQLDPETKEAILKNASLIQTVSIERIRDEFNGMLLGPNPERALQLLHETALLPMLFPEISSVFEDPEKGGGELTQKWPLLLRGMERLVLLYPERSQVFTWAVFLAFFDPDFEKALLSSGEALLSIVEKILSRFRFSHADSMRIKLILEAQKQIGQVLQVSRAQCERWLHQDHFWEALAFYHLKAELMGHPLDSFTFCSQRLHQIKAQSKPFQIFPPQLLTGQDLIQLGLTPGALFSVILREVEDLCLEGALKTKEEALEHIKQKFL